MSIQICQVLAQSSLADKKVMLTRCCGAQRWVEGMMEYQAKDDQDLLTHADEVWWRLADDDFLEAFQHHPQIGTSLDALRARFQTTATWSQQEQASVQQASEDCIQNLARCNQEYLQQNGFIFIICASGKSAAEMLNALQARLANNPAQELKIAAAEQAKITRLRLEKLIS
jgi:2-oxo-4-hydroxy-4-carboxy-5-ureidoimidazoline decarboxylase